MLPSSWLFYSMPVVQLYPQPHHPSMGTPLENGKTKGKECGEKHIMKTVQAMGNRVDMINSLSGGKFTIERAKH
jgi:hypothetical protein